MVLLLLAATLTLAIYLRNKQADRSRHNRERYEDKQDELLEMLRRKKEKENKEDNVS
ncbi:MAG: hypothetical protein ACTHMC_09035 [Pseudobacter sp.]|uniref:hypothetical protein n=1 Tax=Pseudobacter sp. TaxID=2045420 RepID=UPI003F80456B